MNQVKIIWILLLILASNISLGKQEPLKKVGEILSFIDSPENTIALIDGGVNQGIRNNQILEVYRVLDLSPKKYEMQVAKMQIIETRKNESLAIVKGVEDFFSHESKNEYPFPMVGDHVVAKEYVIKKSLSVVPKTQISYFDLFVNPKSMPSSYELSENGRKNLKEVAGFFKSLRFKILYIKGHTGFTHDHSSNQLESLERAKIVRSYLINNFAFDPNRVIAMGMGETDLADESYVYGSERKNRRIEFKLGH